MNPESGQMRANRVSKTVGREGISTCFSPLPLPGLAPLSPLFPGPTTLSLVELHSPLNGFSASEDSPLHSTLMWGRLF